MDENIIFDAKLADAITIGDEPVIQDIFAVEPRHLTAQTPFNGGTWLHYAAGDGTPQSIRCLVALGIGVNTPSFRSDRRLALVDAAESRKIANAEALLDYGSLMDTSASVRNPLFAAIVAKDPDMMRLFLDRQIDSTVRYTSETMTNVDAVVFALIRQELELATIVASNQARGDPVKTNAIVAEALKIAASQRGMKQVQILPSRAHTTKH